MNNKTYEEGKEVTYDKNNPFYKIINRQIPAEIVAENEQFICIKDINPQAPVHLLVIPKGEYMDFTHFMEQAGKSASCLFEFVMQVIRERGLKEYSLRINNGKSAGQCVFHMHVHIMSEGEGTLAKLMTPQAPQTKSDEDEGTLAKLMTPQAPQTKSDEDEG